jgi:uncharacterized damage-inducible protein DinB
MLQDRMTLLLQLRDYSWDQEGWFLPLAEALKGLEAAGASWQPPGGGNTIWQTVNHVNYYNNRMLLLLTGQPPGPQIENDPTFQEPGDPHDTAGWAGTLAETRRIAEGLRQALAERTDADLDQPLGSVSPAPLAERMAAWIMHDTYHTGQIVLIRKQQGSWPAHRG